MTNVPASNLKLDNGQIEVKARKTGNVQMLPADDFVDGIRTVLEELKKSE